MQTLAFLWYELKAAKRHVKEAVAELQECRKADFSLLKKTAEPPVIEERAPRRGQSLAPWIAKKARAGS